MQCPHTVYCDVQHFVYRPQMCTTSFRTAFSYNSVCAVSLCTAVAVQPLMHNVRHDSMFALSPEHLLYLPSCAIFSAAFVLLFAQQFCQAMHGTMQYTAWVGQCVILTGFQSTSRNDTPRKTSGHQFYNRSNTDIYCRERTQMAQYLGVDDTSYVKPMFS